MTPSSEQRARALVANALAGCSNPEWWIGRIAKELDEAAAEERKLRQDAQEALGKALEELALLKSCPTKLTDWLQCYAFHVFVELKHGTVGVVLSRLADGEISRGRAAEDIAKLLMGEKLPPCPVHQYVFAEDEIPAEVVTKLRAELAAETARREKMEARCAEMTAALESIGELLKPHPYISPDEDVTERPIICDLCGQAGDASTGMIAHYPECPYPQIVEAIGLGKVGGSGPRVEMKQVMEERDFYAMALTRHCPVCNGGGIINRINVDDQSGLEECPNCTPARNALAARDRELAARVLEEAAGACTTMERLYRSEARQNGEWGNVCVKQAMAAAVERCVSLLREATAEYRSGARQLPGPASGAGEASNG